MGRPVNKKYFGQGTGDQLKVRAKVGSNAEGDGFIVKQRATNKFTVTVGSNTGTCVLVNKSAGELADNEMILNVKTDSGEVVQVTKLYNRTAITEGNEKVKWSFDASTTDEAVEVADVEDDTLVEISITTQPASDAVAAPAATTFSVVAEGVADLAYQWEVDDQLGGGFTAIPSATEASYEVADSTGLNGYQYRVVVSSTSGAADPVTSNPATLTVS